MTVISFPNEAFAFPNDQATDLVTDDILAPEQSLAKLIILKNWNKNSVFRKTMNSN